MGHIKKIVFFALPLLLCCETSFAEPGTYGELDQLQKERFIFEVKAALSKARQDAGSYGENKKVESSYEAANTTKPQNDTSEYLPSLVKVNGRKAVLILPNGMSRSFTTGEMLPGGRYQVHSVNINGVTVRRITDGKIIPLS